MDELTEDKHPEGELGEYKISRSWDDKYEAERTKRNAAYRRRHPEDFCHTSIFETRPAAEVMHDAAEHPRNAQLFGDLWRRGELAVLFAEPGAGKSILAVQIAEAIARGRPIEPFGYPHSSPPYEGGVDADELGRVSRRGGSLAAIRKQPVLYFDFETTEAQFKERYSLPTKTKRVRRYKFAEGFERATFAEHVDIPEVFKGDLARYIRHSFELERINSDAEVLIIDSVNYLDPNGGPAAAVARMRALKLLASTTGLSILAIMPAKPQRRRRLLSSPPGLGGVAAGRGGSSSAHSSLAGSPPYEGGVDTGLRGRRGGSLFSCPRPIELADLAGGSDIASIADSVFALQRSSLGPDIRYIKHLRARNAPPLYNSEYVLAYRLGRESEPPASSAQKSEPPALVGGQLAPATEHTEHTKYGIVRSLRSRHRSGEVAARPDSNSNKALSSAHSSLVTRHSSLTEGSFEKSLVPDHSSLVTRHSSLAAESPFLGFHFLGILPEADAIRDYAAEARARLDAQDKERLRLARRSSKEILVEGLMDGSYDRYLKGI